MTNPKTQKQNKARPLLVNMNAPVVQAEVAKVVGVTKQAISAMIQEGKLPDCKTTGELISAYCERLRDQAAGRLGGVPGGLDLVQERAALAREQRIAQKMKNDVANGVYAPIGLLSDVLGFASSAVVGHLDQLEGLLRKSCPGIDEEIMTVILRVIANARNEWIRSTCKIVTDKLEAMVDDDEEGDDSESPVLVDELTP